MEGLTSFEDIFKILIATDIHLGYNENDPIRGNDSFIAFEEILKHAKVNNVDFILLGGDLFHESKPSPSCLHKCIVLLRRFCLGDQNVEIEFLSDQSFNFQHLPYPTVNYEDPRINVSIPVFSIHGNHDDLTGANRLSAMDILADIGLVNYFGKWTDLSSIDIHPLLMRKGASKLALYGLSHIKDERLSRLFRDHKVSMPTLDNQEEWFNMFVLHQNRAENRGPKNYIPVQSLPNFLDLIVWGHEHDCRIKAIKSANGIYITQPGSSVATSLAQGESLEKHVGLLKVYKKQFRLDPIKLCTVRPFVFKSFNIPMELSREKKPNEMAQDQVKDIIESMITESEVQITGHPKQPVLPLLRLLVFFSDEQQQFNGIRIGQLYQGRVANPTDMLSMKVRTVTKKRQLEHVPADIDDMSANEERFQLSVEKLIEQYFEDENILPLSVLSVRGLSMAVASYIEKGDTEAISDIYQYQIDKILKKLSDVEVTKDNLDLILEKIRLDREKRVDTEVENILQDENRRRTFNFDSDEDVTRISSDEDEVAAPVNQPTRPTRGRGSRGPRGTRAARTPRARRGSRSRAESELF